MKTSLSFILAAVLLITISSCKKSDTTGGTGGVQDGVVPYLKVGNKWVYNVTGGFTSYTTYTLQVKSDNAGIYTLGTLFDTTPGDDAYEYYQGGYINTYDAGDVKAANQQLQKYPSPAVGDKWTRVTASETYYHEVIAINVPITVPAGTFSCSQIKTTFLNAFNEQTTYWSDQYGEIKVDDLLFSTELASKNF